MTRDKIIIRTSIIGILANVFLAGFKAFVGVLSSSIAVIMDAVNNLSDAFSSVVTIIGTKLAGKQPDKKHPYGYGRIEYISSIVIAAIVMLAGFTSCKESVDKIVHTKAADYSGVSLLIIGVAVFVKYFLGRYVKSAGNKYHSEALVASGTDAMFDSVISLSTLIAAGVSIGFGVSIEGYLGVVISVIILKAGLEIMTDSLGNIIGSRVDRELSVKLKEFISEYPDVLGTYDLILHRYGPEKIIGSVHIELPDEMTAKEIHALSRSISEGVYINYGIILTVGIYASNTENGLFSEMKQKLMGYISEYPQILQMHGFYADSDKMKVSFDLIIDFDSEQKIEMRDAILDKMKQDYPEYTFSAVLDNDFGD